MCSTLHIKCNRIPCRAIICHEYSSLELVWMSILNFSFPSNIVSFIHIIWYLTYVRLMPPPPNTGGSGVPRNRLFFFKEQKCQWIFSPCDSFFVSLKKTLVFFVHCKSLKIKWVRNPSYGLSILSSPLFKMPISSQGDQDGGKFNGIYWGFLKIIWRILSKWQEQKIFLPCSYIRF